MTSTGGHSSADGFAFQQQVAALFLASGAEVEVEVPLGGQEVDLLLTEYQGGEPSSHPETRMRGRNG
jgi:hypothetical protein